MTDRTWRDASAGTGLLDARPTAPLPQSAADALRRLESAFPAATAELHRVERTVAGLHTGESTVVNGTTVTAVSLDVVRAVARYEVATARFDELMARPASELSPAEVDAFGEAQQTIAESLGTLADHGRLDLIGPAETASRYRQASAHCRRLAAVQDYEACADVQDELAMCRCQLEKAGRLDLIGGGV